MKVYIVTSGEYSAYGINGVFSSEEKANEFMGNAPAKTYRIEEYETDVLPPRVYSQRWEVSLRLDGSVYQPYSAWTGCSHPMDITEEHSKGERGAGHTSAGFYDDRRDKDRDYGWFCGYSFVSAEHAMKLAVEQRQKALREHPEFFEGVG